MLPFLVSFENTVVYSVDVQWPLVRNVHASRHSFVPMTFLIRQKASDLSVVTDEGKEKVFPGQHEIVFWRGHGAEESFTVNVSELQRRHV